MRSYLIILYLLTVVVIGAAGDALNDEGIKTFGHLLGAVEIALLVLCWRVLKIEKEKWLPFIIIFICIRIVGFDYTYNFIREIPIFEIGTSNWWDRFLSKFPVHGVTFARGVFLVLGVGLSFKFFRTRPC